MSAVYAVPSQRRKLSLRVIICLLYIQLADKTRFDAATNIIPDGGQTTPELNASLIFVPIIWLSWIPVGVAH